MGVGIGKKMTYVEEGIFIFEEMGQLGKQRVTPLRLPIVGVSYLLLCTTCI
jgi:hypothetical protein